jgi:segregation and condensation protein A
MQYFDLELAGEFILMASTLMYVKAQMLLPRPKNDEDSEIEDPRTGLVKKLLEYKLFKDASTELSELAESQKYVYYKKLFDADNSLLESTANYKNANLFDLVNAFRIVLNKSEAIQPKHEVHLETLTVEQKVESILNTLKMNKRISFFEFTALVNRSHIIVTFLAILELMKYQKIWIHQDENFQDIIIMDRNDKNLDLNREME